MKRCCKQSKRRLHYILILSEHHKSSDVLKLIYLPLKRTEDRPSTSQHSSKSKKLSRKAESTCFIWFLCNSSHGLSIELAWKSDENSHSREIQSQSPTSPQLTHFETYERSISRPLRSIVSTTTFQKRISCNITPI